MRESQKYALEEELREKVLARIVIIQRWVRAKLMRCRFLHMRRSAIILQVHTGVQGFSQGEIKGVGRGGGLTEYIYF